MNKKQRDGVTVSSVLDKRTPNKDGKYPVKIKVYFQKIPKYYSTGICLTAEEWERLENGKSRDCREIKAEIEKSFSFVKQNVDELIDRGSFSFDTLNLRLGRATGSTLNDAIRAKIEELRNEERIGTMQFYQCTLMMVEEFAGKHIEFSAITVDWLKRCERYWLKTRKVSTVGMHFRNIRALMNEAKRAGTIREAQYPFGKDKFEIKTGESIKKGLTQEQLKEIFNYTSDNQTTNRYKDLWIFIYLCNGINPTDMLKLKYSDITDNEIRFVRQKTERTTRNRKEIRVSVTPIMESIIKEWGNPPQSENYIFPYLTGNETAEQRKALTRDVVKRINKRMKKIGEELGIGIITTYTARHTFATILKRSGVAIASISESLGHTDVRTTDAYLASFEKKERDKNAALLTSFL